MFFFSKYEANSKANLFAQVNSRNNGNCQSQHTDIQINEKRPSNYIHNEFYIHGCTRQRYQKQTKKKSQ